MPFPGRNTGQDALPVVGILAGRGSDSQDAFWAVSEVGGPSCPRYIRALDHNTVAADGSRLYGPWGSLRAIPPELRRFIATQHEHLRDHAQHRRIAMLPGSTHGRMSQQSIRHALAELDAPASLWHDPPGTTIGDGANADGRMLLHTLSAWNLWLRRQDRRQNDP